MLIQLPAAQFCSVNSTYRADYDRILAISRDTCFPIGECAGCGFVYAGWLPPQDFLRRVYDDVIDGDEGFRQSHRPTWVSGLLKVAASLLSFFDETPGTEGERLRILDIGCGYGVQLNALRGPRVEVLGLETSARRLSHLAGLTIPAVASTEGIESALLFDGVICSDVLEHVADPRGLLTFVRESTRPGSVVYVSVPDYSRRRLQQQLAAARGGREFPRTLNPWEHLNYFSPLSLHAMMKSEGFVHVEEPGAVDVGLSPGLAGIRRWRNGARAMLTGR